MNKIYFVWAVPSKLLDGKEKDVDEKVLDEIRIAVHRATDRLSAAAYVESWDDNGEIIKPDEYPVVHPDRLNYSPNLTEAIAKIKTTVKENFPGMLVRVDKDLTPFHLSLFKYEK